MATNPSEVAGGVSIADATAALTQSESEAEAFEAEEIQEDPNGGEGEELDQGETDPEAEAAEDGDQDEDPDQDEAEDGDDEDGDDPWISIKIDGEEQEVRLSELRNGYQRQADYTRKTQELARQRGEVEQGQRSVQQQAVAYAQAYLQTADQLAALAPSEDDIKAAWGYDPQEAAALKEKRDSILQQAAQTRNLAVSLHRQQQEQLKQQMAEAGRKLPELIPEWSDQNVRKQEVISVAEYLVQQGLNPKDVEQTANPVAWAIARKAWQFDQLQKSTGAKEAKQPAPKIRTARSPKPRLPAKRQQAARAKQQFNKAPTKDNAVAFLAQFEE